MFVDKNFTVKPGFTPIPLGAWVRITRSPGPMDLRGRVGRVIGYDVRDRTTREVNAITMLHLDRGPLAFLQYPQCFPWEVERVTTPEIPCDACHGDGGIDRPCRWCHGTGVRTLTPWSEDVANCSAKPLDRDARIG